MKKTKEEFKYQIALHPGLLWIIWFSAAGLLEWLLSFRIPGEFYRIACIFAAPLILFSIGFGHCAITPMQRARTPVDPGFTPVELVKSGSFAFSRNPLYVSLLCFSAGLSLALGSLWHLLGCVPYFLILSRWVIPHEEIVLETKFSESYREYCSKVRRWL
jgi:protein-S-isoprenylcysteine O-methyltransferase Ste14